MKQFLQQPQSIAMRPRIGLIFLMCLLSTLGVNAQALSGTYTIPGSYATIAAAITDLNANGVTGSGVTFEIDGGYTETAPVGGFRVTATGTASTPIVFQKSTTVTGANPLITAPVGTVTMVAASTTVDGIWSFVGSDYITIDGIDLVDLNTMSTAVSGAMPSYMEYGYGFFRNSATDGCQNNTIKNCTVTLQGVVGSSAGPTIGSVALTGSTGILFASVKDNALTTTIAATALTGSNSNNKIQSNTLTHCYNGISVFGTATASPYANADYNNEIGGTAGLGNTINGYGTTITNYFKNNTAYSVGDVFITANGAVYKVTTAGTSHATTVPSSTITTAITNGTCTLYYLYGAATATGISTGQQYGITISNNTLNNTAGTGSGPAIMALRGIFVGASPGASSTVTYNTLTLRAATSNGVEAITTGTGGSVNSNTITISHNTISVVMGMRPNTSNGALDVQPTGNMIPIYNQAISTNLYIENNTFTADTSYSTGTTTYMIYNTQGNPGIVSYSNNDFSMVFPGTTAYGATLYGIYSTGTTNAATVSIDNNTFSNFKFTTVTSATYSLYFINIAGSSNTLSIRDNVWDNLTLNVGHATYLIQNSNSTVTSQTIQNNSILTGLTFTGATPNFWGYYENGTPALTCLVDISGNNFSNITATAVSGTGGFYGINAAFPTASPYARKLIYNNTVSNINYNTTGNAYGMYLGYLGELGGIGSSVYSNTVSGMTTSSSALNGIYFLSNASPNYTPNVYMNKVSGISNNNATSCNTYGMYLASSAIGINVYQNKVGDMQIASPAGGLYGIFTATANPYNIHNNVVGDLRAPNHTGTNSVNGIYVSTGSTVNISYNTVNIGGTLATNGNSNGIYMNTVSTVTCINNVVVNTSIASGTGLASAIRRSNVTLASYGSLSNNNLLYTTETALNPIFTDGTNTDNTLALYQARVTPRDANSIKENITFISQTFSSDFFLHPDSTIATNLEGGATPVSGIVADYNGTVRAGNPGYLGLASNPDMGAYEANYTGVAMVYDQASAGQNTASILAAAAVNNNQVILKIAVNMVNASSALPLTSLKFNTSGTTNVTDITNAKVFSTGSNPVFSTTNQYGTTVTGVNGTFYVTGSQLLNAGINYFWLTYDVANTATSGQLFDARLDSLLVGGTNYLPTMGDPVGARQVRNAMSGVYTIGTSSNYNSLTEALADLNILGVSGPVTLELATTYTSTGETFPITFGNVVGTNATNTITVMPHSTAVGLSITSANPTATIDLNGARYITIEGRSGGSGSMNLEIGNTNVSGNAVRLINDACFNKLQYSTFKGVNTGVTSGVVLFSTGITRGNDSNTISNCDIREGATNPVNGIVTSGNTSAALNNSNNKIENCNIYNFWAPVGDCAGIKIINGNTDLTISGNSIYQTQPLAVTGTATQYGIYASTSITTLNNLVVSNNYIGGIEPLCGGATPWTVTGSTSFRFTGAYLNLGAVTTPALFSGNTISNINISNGTTAYSGIQGVFSGVYLVTGLADVIGNTIGSMSTADAIVVNTSVGGNLIVPIGSATTATGTVNIKQNNLGGITVNGSAATIHSTFFGTYITTATSTTTFVIDDNIFGNGLADNIKIATASTSATGQQMAAINSTATSNFKIRNNTIQNFKNAAVGASTTPVNWLHAIDMGGTSGVDTIVGNTISGLVTDLAYQNNNNGSAALLGLRVVPASAGNYIAKNTIKGLVLTNTGGNALSVIGMLTNNMLAGSSFEQNFVHSFPMANTSTSSTIIGIYAGGGTVRYVNNIIRLGIDSTGTSVTVPAGIYGLFKAGGAIRALHNSVYIGGTGVANAAVNTFAYFSGVTGVDSIMNNVFANTRANTTTGGTHYAIGLSGNTTLSCNTNDYWSLGSLGAYNNVAMSGLSQWQAASGRDGASVFYDPHFTAPDGGYTSMDMHINPTPGSVLESGGIPIADITVDYFNQARVGLTPTDIGAEAGNYSGIDLAPPIITHTNVINTGNTGDRTIRASILDGTGLSVTGSAPPMVYYKLMSAGSYISASGTLVSGTPQNGQWDFVLSASALGTLAPGDSIYYYIIAVDSSINANYGSLPGGATGTYAIPVAPSTEFKYAILKAFNGTIQVGGTSIYQTLTGTGGVFDAINKGVLTDNVIVEVVDSLVEPGTVALNQFMEEGAGNYTLSIVPDDASHRLISGLSAPNTSLITFNGADRVIIDGSYAGSGKYLTLRNRATGTTMVVKFLNDAKRDTIRNVAIESVNQHAAINFNTPAAGGTGNDSSAIMYCILSDTTGSPNTATCPNSMIYSDGANNSDITIAYNEMFNYIYQGINIASAATNNDNWKIIGNAFYQGAHGRALASATPPGTSATHAMKLSAGSGHTIQDNSIGGSAVDRSGFAYRAMWNASTTPSFIAMELSLGTASTTTVSNNTISNISSIATTSTSAMFGGIHVMTGLVDVLNNTIGGGMNAYDTIMEASSTSSGGGAIYVGGSTTVRIIGNTVSHLKNYINNTASQIRTTGIFVGAGTSVTISKNNVHDIYSASGAYGTTAPSNHIGASPCGIYVSAVSTTVTTIDSNIVYNIINTNTSTTPGSATGITIYGGTCTVSRNRIYDVYGMGTGTDVSGTYCYGILVRNGSHTFLNNQISIGANAGGESNVFGIRDINTASGTNAYYYNSVYLSGQTATGVNPSYAMQRLSSSITNNVRNNIFCNNRTSGGSGNNYAFGSSSATNFSANAVMYNLMIGGDTSKLIELPSGTNLGVGAINASYTGSSYNTNWMLSATALNSANLFTDVTTGDLSINTSNADCWYMNGKGIALSNVSGDFYSGTTAVRSTSVANGPSDIGSVEFTTSTTPAPAYQVTAPAASSTSDYVWAGRKIASIDWGTAGTLPSSVSVVYNSGIAHANVIAGRTQFSSYVTMTPVGGSGYTATVSMIADSAIYGSVTTAPKLAYYRAAEWNFDASSTTVKGMLVAGLTSATVAGDYTGTDGSNPLPVTLLNFTATAAGNDVVLNWRTASERDNRGFEIQRSTDGVNFDAVGFVAGKEHSNSVVRYQSIDKQALTSASRLYYRLAQQEMNGAVNYSEIATVAVTNRTAQQMSVYPNPFTTTTQVMIESATDKTQTMITVTDLSGKVLVQQTADLHKGVNVIDITALESLTTGIYFIQTTTNGVSQTQKVVKAD